MGRIPGQAAHRADTIVFASETCAFDLIGAVYEREVKPGELVIVGPEGVHSRFYATAQPQSSCIFEHVYFSRPDSMVFGTRRAGRRATPWDASSRWNPRSWPTSSCRCPTPASPPRWASRTRAASRCNSA